MKLPPTRIVLRSAPGGSVHPVTLGMQAAAVLDKLCLAYKVKPEHVLQAIAEFYLRDLSSDDTLSAIANPARTIEATGRAPDYWWEPTVTFEPPGSEDR